MVTSITGVDDFFYSKCLSGAEDVTHLRELIFELLATSIRVVGGFNLTSVGGFDTTFKR
jgi:hypothetical protein